MQPNTQRASQAIILDNVISSLIEHWQGLQGKLQPRGCSTRRLFCGDRTGTARSGLVGGERGIRTLDTGLSPYNALAGRPLRPLGHLSVALTNRCPTAGISPKYGNFTR